MMKYEEFIGEKKSKIAEIMGHGFNYFPNNIWTYCNLTHLRHTQK